MLFEGFLQGIMNYLGVPPGVLLRKNYGVNNTNKSSYDITENDYVSTILDITVDDICIGNSPLTYTCSENIPDTVRSATDQICEEFNKIMKWTARDLCVYGYSIYTAEVIKKEDDEIENGDIKEKLLLLPYLDNVEFYMNKKGEIVVFNTDETKKVNLDNIVLFINFDKTCLRKIENEGDKQKIDKSILFSVSPMPMQLKKCASTVKSLSLCESALLRYRTQLSRIARYVNVDVGTSQGDQADDVVDAISSAINANSLSLMSSDDTMLYDDAIPVIPNRRGLGKPELECDIPQYDLKDLADIDYFLSKIALLAKFPATYIDFTKVLDSGVATTIKGDIRYSKLCKSVRSCINDTVNSYVKHSKNFKDYDIVFLLNTSPDSEDADRNTALSDITTITDEMHRFIIGDEVSGDTVSMRARLDLLKNMLGSKCTSTEVADFFDVENQYIDTLEEEQDMNDFSELSMEGDEGFGAVGGLGGGSRPTPPPTSGEATGEPKPTVEVTSEGEAYETFPLDANE